MNEPWEKKVREYLKKEKLEAEPEKFVEEVIRKLKEILRGKGKQQ